MSQKAILKWLEEQGIATTPADPVVVAEYERKMRKEVIPKIIEDMKRNARAVARERHRPLF